SPDKASKQANQRLINDREENKNSTPRSPPQRQGPLHWLILLLLGFAMFSLFASSWGSDQAISYTTLLEQIEQGNVSSLTIRGREVTGDFKEPIQREVAPEQEASAEQESFKQFFCVLPPQVGESWLE